MTHSQTEITTPHASRYLQQLCKHFAHKLTVAFDPAQGSITFDIGDVRLTAEGERLTIALTAPGGEQLERLKDIVIRHLERFAFREELAVEWRDS
jgi:hypothetical protein